MSDGRRTRANGRASRDAITAAAAELFAHRGYRGTRLVDVADAVGITKPGLAYHFAGKDDLLLAVVAQRESVMNESWVVAVEGAGSFSETLARMLGSLGASNARDPQLQRLLLTLVAEAVEPGHPLHGYFRARYVRVRAAISTLVRRAQAVGECRADVDADAFALEAVAMMDGLGQQWLLDPDAVDIRHALAAWGRRVTDDLRPGGVPGAG